MDIENFKDSCLTDISSCVDTMCENISLTFNKLIEELKKKIKNY